MERTSEGGDVMAEEASRSDITSEEKGLPIDSHKVNAVTDIKDSHRRNLSLKFPRKLEPMHVLGSDEDGYVQNLSLQAIKSDKSKRNSSRKNSKCRKQKKSPIVLQVPETDSDDSSQSSVSDVDETTGGISTYDISDEEDFSWYMEDLMDANIPGMEELAFGGYEDGEPDEPVEEPKKEIIYPYGNLVPGERECEICLETDVGRRYRKCCRICVCDECMNAYFACQVENGIVRIGCVSDRCDQYAHVEEIMCRLPACLKNKYYKFLVDANNDPYVKTCPRCNYIHHVNKEDMNAQSKQLKKFGYSVCCPDCKLVWCFPCHAPEHKEIKCKEFRKGDKLVKTWAKERKYGQKNAEKCPKCKVYIERNGGCDHMTCEKCYTSFCYCCGERFIHLRFIGDHFGKYSPFGCKYKLLPDRPVLRRTIRGSILGAKLIGAIGLGAIVVGAGALFLALSPVWAPIYLGRRIHLRRRAEKRRKKFSSRYKKAAASSLRRGQRDFRDIDDIVAADIAEMMRQYLEEKANQNLPDLIGQVGKPVIRLSDSEMTSSQSSTDSSLTSDPSHEDEVLNVRVEGHSGGSENVSVWIHSQHKEKKKLPSQKSKDDAVTSLEVKDKDDKEIVISDCDKDIQTTAKISKTATDSDAVVLHVKTTSKSSKKDPKVVPREVVTNSEADASNSPDFVTDASENKKSTNGCFVALFGRKLPTLSENDAGHNHSTSEESNAVQTNSRNSAADGQLESRTDKYKAIPDVLKSSLEADQPPIVDAEYFPQSEDEVSTEGNVDSYYGVIAEESIETSL
ncbi:hypothetical protein FSP39_019444 [Pinctada imbricata]|uniref:RBR-type E3 ubiquitin transferase n=1 Tax=Pinctada imbricata TaxID=66713 RepID=A0AA88Y382_PINIB|nr:hypothetical protein FSP39_019444 [Pinctada imbricata]